jgi:hypothetical protein
MEAFKAVRVADSEDHVQSLMVCADNDTRWNSTFTMIERALRISRSIDFFLSNTDDLDDDVLTTVDWKFLRELYKILQPLEELTKDLEGKAEKGIGGTIGEVLPALDLIKCSLEESRARHENLHGLANEWAVNAIDNGLDHVDKYHEIVCRIPAYQAATALDPGVKWGYFERNYTSQSVEETKRVVRTLWETEYKRAPPAGESAQPTTAAPSSHQQPNKLREFMLRGPQGAGPGSGSGSGSGPGVLTTSRGRTRRASPPDELDRWMAEPVEDLVTDIIAFWRAKRGAYPQLSTMALELYSLPAMSAEVERVFSR